MSWFRNLSKFSAITKAPNSTRNTYPFHQPLTFLSHHFTTNNNHGGLESTKPHEKPRVVVLGTGWAGCRLMKGLDPEIYDIVCVSPRNHMVFTPLLASTCLEPWSLEPLLNLLRGSNPPFLENPVLISSCQLYWR